MRCTTLRRGRWCRAAMATQGSGSWRYMVGDEEEIKSPIDFPFNFLPLPRENPPIHTPSPLREILQKIFLTGSRKRRGFLCHRGGAWPDPSGRRWLAGERPGLGSPPVGGMVFRTSRFSSACSGRGATPPLLLPTDGSRACRRELARG
jgi:hypothetical protein